MKSTSYMATLIKAVNHAITFEQSAFSEMYKLKTFDVSC